MLEASARLGAVAPSVSASVRNRGVHVGPRVFRRAHAILLTRGVGHRAGHQHGCGARGCAGDDPSQASRHGASEPSVRDPPRSEATMRSEGEPPHGPSTDGPAALPRRRTPANNGAHAGFKQATGGAPRIHSSFRSDGPATSGRYCRTATSCPSSSGESPGAASKPRDRNAARTVLRSLPETRAIRATLPRHWRYSAT